MSTTINVTVGGNGLLDQSRQQMQANRFGRLERDQDKQIEAQVTEQRQIQTGQQDLTARLPAIGRSYPRPAANRRDSTLSVIIGPFAEDAYSVSDGYNILVPKIKGKNRLNFCSTTFTSTPPEFSTSERFLFESGTGPAGTNAYVSPAANPSPKNASLMGVFCSNGTAQSVDIHTDRVLINGNVENVESPLTFADLPGITMEVFVYHSSDGIYNGCLMRFSDTDFLAAIRGSGVAFPGSDYLDNQFYVYDSWNHFAFTFQDGLAESFVNGNKASSTTIVDFLQADPLHSVSLLFNNNLGVANRTRFHGFRFTAKRLYTDSFTPPQSVADYR